MCRASLAEGLGTRVPSPRECEMLRSDLVEVLGRLAVCVLLVWDLIPCLPASSACVSASTRSRSVCFNGVPT